MSYTPTEHVRGSYADPEPQPGISPYGDGPARADDRAAGRRRAPKPTPGRTVSADATPGLLEALGYVGDRADRLENKLGDLLKAVHVLEAKLAPILRQAPPYASVGDPGVARGPASDESSVLAQQLTSAALRTDRHADELADLADRLEHLTGLVDLA